MERRKYVPCNYFSTSDVWSVLLPSPRRRIVLLACFGAFLVAPAGERQRCENGPFKSSTRRAGVCCSRNDLAGPFRIACSRDERRGGSAAHRADRARLSMGPSTSSWVIPTARTGRFFRSAG